MPLVIFSWNTLEFVFWGFGISGETPGEGRHVVQHERINYSMMELTWVGSDKDGEIARHLAFCEMQCDK